jgi:hypothetical protein
LGVDPAMESARLSQPQSWNRFTYAFSNPIAFYDPNGEAGREYRWKSFKFVLDTAHGGPHIDVFSTKGGGSRLLARVDRATGQLIRHKGSIGSVPGKAMVHMKGRGWIPVVGMLAGGVLSLLLDADPLNASEAASKEEDAAMREAQGAVIGALNEITGDLYGQDRDVFSLTPEELKTVFDELEKRAREEEEKQRRAERSVNELSGVACSYSGSC